MAIKRLREDSIEAIVRNGQIDGMGLRGLAEEPDGLAVLERWRPGIEKILEDFDKRWTALCKDDLHELTEWASRMRFIRMHLDEIDRNLATKGTRLFSWDRVIPAMGLVNAFRVAIEQTLDYNDETAAA